MSFYKLLLSANKPLTQDTRGAVLLIDKIIGADSVDLTILQNGQRQSHIPDRRAAFKYVARFDAVVFEASADCEVWVFLSMNEVSLGVTDGTEVSVTGSVGITNDAGNPVPTTRAALSTLVDHLAATITVGAGQLLISDPTLKRLVVRNASLTQSVGIGGASVTMATAAIVLLPGDTWDEGDAAGAPWYATSDAAGADVRVLGVK